MSKRGSGPWRAWQSGWALLLYRRGVLVFTTENGLLAYASNHGIVIRRGTLGPKDQTYYALSAGILWVDRILQKGG